MGRIADIPTGYWLTCVELREPKRSYIVPNLKAWLDDLLRTTVTDHDPLLSKWKISVTRIDSGVALARVQEQFCRDDNSFRIQKTIEVDLRELAQEWGMHIQAD